MPENHNLPWSLVFSMDTDSEKVPMKAPLEHFGSGTEEALKVRNLIDSRFHEGKDKMKQREFKDAIASFSEALKACKEYAKMEGSSNDAMFGSVSLLVAESVASIYVGRGRCFQLQEQHEKAIEDFSRAIESSASSSLDLKKTNSELVVSTRCQAFVLRASSYVSIKRADLAFEDYEAASFIDDRNPSIYTGRANLYMIMQQFEAALQNCELALSLDSNEFYAYHYMGMIYAQINRNDEAIRAFDRALELMVHYDTLILRGKAHNSAGNSQQALEDFSRAIILEPDTALAYGNRAALFAQVGKLEKAIEDCSMWIQRSDAVSALSAYQARGVWQAQLKNYNAAIADFTHVIESDPTHILAYSSRGTAYSHMGRHEESISDWLSVSELRPKWTKPFWCIADEYVSMKEFASAINFYSEAIKCDPENVTTYQQRAHAYAKIDLYEQAIVDLNSALQLEKSRSLYEERAYLYTRLEQYNRAISDMNNAIAFDVKNVVNYEKRAAIFLKMGEAACAKTDMLLAKRLKREAEEREREAIYDSNPATESTPKIEKTEDSDRMQIDGEES